MSVTRSGIPGRLSFPPRLLVAGTMALAGLLAVTACSGSSDSKANASASGGSSACATEAAKLIAQRSGPVQQPLPTEKVSTAKSKGKTFWIIANNQAAPVQQKNIEGFQAAAKALGIKVQTFDGKSSPDRFSQAVSTAVGQKAGGIVLLSINPSVVAAPLASAEAAGIPIIDGYNGDPNAATEKTFLGHVTTDGKKLGVTQADYVLAQTKCKTHSVIVVVEGAPSQKLFADAAVAEYARLCSSCKLDVLSVPIADFATKLTGLTQSTLQRSPDINFVIAATDSMMSYVGLAVTQLGKSVPILGTNGDTLADARKGGPQKADLVYPPQQFVGWLYMDALLRAADGKTSNYSVESRSVDKDNWGSDSTSIESFWPSVDGYQDKFKALWTS